MRILLVDDDKDLRELTQYALNKHGYETTAVGTAEEAITYAQANKPHLILMDLVLPGMSGEEAVMQLSEDENLQNIPVVFLTGLLDSSQNQSNQTLRVNGLNYLSLGKPFTIEKLLEVVRKFDHNLEEKKDL